MKTIETFVKPIITASPRESLTAVARLVDQHNRVEPHVHARAEQLGQRQVTFLQVHDADVVRQRRGSFEHAADQSFAPLVARVRFTGTEHLERSRVSDDRPQAGEIGEEQVRPLVRGGSTGEAERHCRGVEPDAAPSFDFRQQVAASTPRGLAALLRAEC
jgi:hypothetical protein